MAITFRVNYQTLNYTQMDNNWVNNFVLKGTGVSTSTTANYGSGIVALTKMVFYMSAAPTGWTTQSVNDMALRVVSDNTTGGTTGGTTGFSSVFTSKTPTGTVSSIGASTSDASSLSIAQMPSHNHGYSAVSSGGAALLQSTGGQKSNGTFNMNNSGSGTSHTHTISSLPLTFTGNALDFSVKYANVLICSKN